MGAIKGAILFEVCGALRGMRPESFFAAIVRADDGLWLVYGRRIARWGQFGRWCFDLNISGSISFGRGWADG